MGNTMEQNTLDLNQWVQAILKHRKAVLLITAGSVLALGVASFVVPKKYKSQSVIAIYSRYFQNPLIKDFVSDLPESNELKPQRESLIKAALTDAYVDELGAKLGFFKSSASSVERWKEREELRKRIEIYALTSSSFRIAAVFQDATTSYQAAQLLLARVQETLSAERRDSLLRLREAMKSRLESLAYTQGARDAELSAGVELQGAREELARVESELQGLSRKFTERHPRITELKARAQALRASLGERLQGPTGAASTGMQDNRATLKGLGRQGQQELTQDLLRKLNYVQIALEMEARGDSNHIGVVELPAFPTAPIWPSKRLFLLQGLLLGWALSLAYVLYREHRNRRAISPEQFAEALGSRNWGALPELSWNLEPRNQSSSTRPQPRIGDWQ